MFEMEICQYYVTHLIFECYSRRHHLCQIHTDNSGASMNVKFRTECDWVNMIL